MSLPNLPLGLYVHFPWCIRKCPYCDFNSHEAGSAVPEDAYIDALLADLRHDIDCCAESRPLQSIFMGGGTPSLFGPEALERLLTGIRSLLPLTTDCEITLEANPGTFESDKFRAYRELGINRLSIGIQSFTDRHLRQLGRIHDAAAAIRAVELARQAGFDNFNLDFMFGLPGQSVAEALADLETAIALAPSHLSFYQLTLEPNTYFHKFPPSLPDDDRVFAIQAACQQLMAAHGYRQYEVSAYARTGYHCRHNLNYWRFGDYLGIGAGAHGKFSRQLPGNILRTAKLRHPQQYLARPTAGSRGAVATEQLPLEFLMNHLRLVEGFAPADFSARTGLPLQALQPGLDACFSRGLLAEISGRIVCTPQGWNFLDAILETFVPEA